MKLRQTIIKPTYTELYMINIIYQAYEMHYIFINLLMLPVLPLQAFIIYF